MLKVYHNSYLPRLATVVDHDALTQLERCHSSQKQSQTEITNVSRLCNACWSRTSPQSYRFIRSSFTAATTHDSGFPSPLPSALSVHQSPLKGKIVHCKFQQMASSSQPQMTWNLYGLSGWLINNEVWWFSSLRNNDYCTKQWFSMISRWFADERDEDGEENQPKVIKF